MLKIYIFTQDPMLKKIKNVVNIECKLITQLEKVQIKITLKFGIVVYELNLKVKM